MAVILDRWNGLETTRKLVVALGLVALVTVVGLLIRMMSQPSMVLLYSGLEASQASGVVNALEQRGEAFEIKGDSIFVAAAQRDALRMSLAGDGLPTNSAKGYELLDSLSGFGTTSQMFDAAYIRAKEGELARTIVASPQISTARVHLAVSQHSGFRRGDDSSASVFVTGVAAAIDPSQAKALRFLVSSAVAGLTPEKVSIIDAQGRLISADEDAVARGQSDDLDQELKARVERLLAARVGAGNAIVEVSVQKVLQSESISERIFDPQGRVAISIDTQERTDSAEDAGNGSVTVASNLPDGDGSELDTSKSQASETRERTNYEVSETQREIVKAPGAIKRISVAVLVNGVVDPARPDAISPRPPEELEQLSALVRSAVGFDDARGDVITVESMEFAPIAPQGSGPAESSLFDFTLDVMTIIQMAILAVVGLVVALAVVRPVLTASAPPNTLALENSDDSAEFGSDDLNFDTGPMPGGDFDLPTANVVDFDFGDAAMGDQSDLASMGSFPSEDASPIQKLRDMIETRQEDAVEILSQWLEDKEKQEVGL